MDGASTFMKVLQQICKRYKRKGEARTGRDNWICCCACTQQIGQKSNLFKGRTIQLRASDSHYQFEVRRKGGDVFMSTAQSTVSR